MDNLLQPITARVAAFGCFLLVGACDGPEKFSWENHPTLSWNDFRGTNVRFEPGTAASTHSGWFVAASNCDGTLDVRGTAEFQALTSWVRPNRKTPLILKHEQGHFDITELYARKVTKAIRDARISCESSAEAVAAVERIMNQLEMNLRAAHKQYDTATKGGREPDPIAQAAASNSIANELASLDSYKSNR